MSEKLFRCGFITKRGNRCKRMSQKNTRCYQHCSSSRTRVKGLCNVVRETNCSYDNPSHINKKIQNDAMECATRRMNFDKECVEYECVDAGHITEINKMIHKSNDCAVIIADQDTIARNRMMDYLKKQEQRDKMFAYLRKQDELRK